MLSPYISGYRTWYLVKLDIAILLMMQAEGTQNFIHKADDQIAAFIYMEGARAIAREHGVLK